jgi:hypothetical protein
MLFAGTPINQARAGIVQDLYRLAFLHQLEASSLDASAANEPIGEDEIVGLLRDIADVLDRTEHREDAAVLMSLASDTAPRRQWAGAVR